MFRITYFDRSLPSVLLTSILSSLFATTTHASPTNSLVNDDTSTFVIGDTVTIKPLDNDQRSNLDTSSFYLSSLPRYGYIRVRNDFSMTYTNYGNRSTRDSFTYRIADYNGTFSDPVTVSLTTLATSQTASPAASTAASTVNGSASVSDMNVPVGGSTTLELPIDSSSFNLTTLWTTTPTNGYTTIPYSGAVRYQHYVGQGRTDSFDYSVADYNGNYIRRTITVSIGDGNSQSTIATLATPTTTTTTPIISNSGWWQPRASDNLKWQLQLQGDIRLIPGVKVYAADSTASQASINAAKANGAKLKCYISAGSSENYRSDFSSIPSYVIGNIYANWPGERWLNTREINALAPVMRARMDTCKRKGFDAIDADNVNGHENNTGFNLSRSDSIAYIKWLAAEAHARGMAFSLKNSESLIDDVINQVDMLQTESCYIYNNCANASKMSARNKAVFAVEYQENLNSSNFNQNVCPNAAGFNFSMIYRNLLLTPGGVYQSCN